MPELTKEQVKILKKAFRLGKQAGDMALKQQEKVREFNKELAKLLDEDVVSELPNLCDPICDLIDYGSGMTYEEFEVIIKAAIEEDPEELLSSVQLEY